MQGRPLVRNIRKEVSATFLADGTCTAVVNVPPGPAWEVKQITVRTNVTATLTECTTFVGTNSSGVRISHTFLGNDDTDSQPNTTIRYGESLCAFWTNGIAGKLATMTVIYDEVGY